VGRTRDDRTRRKALSRAQRGVELVQIRRGISGADLIEGYVLDVGARWVLLGEIDDGIRTDGVVAIRIKDIRGVKSRENANFVRRALELQGEWPPRAPDPPIDLSDRRAVITSFAQIFPVLALHIERRDPDVCFIGVFRGFTKRWVRLREVTWRATWEPEDSGFRRRDITRVDGGGHYQRALLSVAGPPPDGPCSACTECTPRPPQAERKEERM
jgi:hypothetical protein